MRNAVILPFEGGPIQKLFQIDSELTQWSSDGKQLLYVQSRDGVGNVWSIPVAGGKSTQLTNFTSERIRTFALSSNGDLVLSRGTVNRDVVLIRDLK